MAVRNALIVTNTIGMFHFLWSDIDMLNQMGYRVFAMADNSAREEHTLRIMQEKGVTFVDARVDSNSMLSRNNLKFYKQLKQLLASRHLALCIATPPQSGFSPGWRRGNIEERARR